MQKKKTEHEIADLSKEYAELMRLSGMQATIQTEYIFIN
jgi:hypothetical protein